MHRGRIKPYRKPKPEGVRVERIAYYEEILVECHRSGGRNRKPRIKHCIKRVRRYREAYHEAI